MEAQPSAEMQATLTIRYRFSASIKGAERWFLCLGLVLSKINMIEVDFPYLRLVLEMFSLGSEFVGSQCLVQHHQVLNYQKMYF